MTKGEIRAGEVRRIHSARYLLRREPQGRRQTCGSSSLRAPCARRRATPLAHPWRERGLQLAQSPVAADVVLSTMIHRLMDPRDLSSSDLVTLPRDAIAPEQCHLLARPRAHAWPFQLAHFLRLRRQSRSHPLKSTDTQETSFRQLPFHRAEGGGKERLVGLGSWLGVGCHQPSPPVLPLMLRLDSMSATLCRSP